MNIFKFEAPIAEAIRQRFILDVDSVYPNASKGNLFLDHEPPDGELFSYSRLVNENGARTDGVVAVYAGILEGINASSQTGEQETNNTINVDCYGFGDVFNNEDESIKSSISAQKRAQVLTSLAFKAIMDATELNNDFGTGIEISEKIYIKTEKVGAIGPEGSSRTICFYRSQYSLRIEEAVPTESLGLDYDGGSTKQETENP